MQLHTCYSGTVLRMPRFKNPRNIRGCSDFISFLFLFLLRMHLSGTPRLRPALALIPCPGMLHRSCRVMAGPHREFDSYIKSVKVTRIKIFDLVPIALSLDVGIT